MAKIVSKRPGPRARKAKQSSIRWPKPQKRRILPAWMPVAAVIGLCAMLVLTVNFRAFSELSKERRRFEDLNGKIQQATSENLSLQEEIFYLKNDPNTIEREARKFGLGPAREEQVPVAKIEEEPRQLPKKESKPKEEPKQDPRTEKTDKKPLERDRVVKKSESTPVKKEKVSQAGEPDKAEKSANRQLPTRK